MDSSNVVGSMARPILLYYGLCQALRAIIAARSGRSPSGHGLSASPAPGTTIEGLSLSAWRTKPNGHGMFQDACEVLGSPGFGSETNLDRLVASLPGWLSYEYPSLLEVVKFPHWTIGRNVWWRDRMAVVVRIGRETKPGHPTKVFDIGKYPALSEWRVSPEDVSIYVPDGLYGTEVVELWKARREQISLPAKLDEGLEEEIDKVSITENLTQYIRPAVGDSGEVPSVMITWLVLLFGMSIAARYYPALWRNSNRSDNRNACRKYFGDFVGSWMGHAIKSLVSLSWRGPQILDASLGSVRVGLRRARLLSKNAVRPPCASPESLPRRQAKAWRSWSDRREAGIPATKVVGPAVELVKLLNDDARLVT